MGKLTLVEQALRLHKEYYGEDNFGTIVKDCDYYPKVAEIFINRKNRKIYSNLDIEPVASTVVHTGSSPVMAKAGRIKKLMFKDGSGAYRIHLGQNEVVHIIRFILNSKVRMEYAVGTTKSMSMLHNLCEAGRAKLNRSLPRSVDVIKNARAFLKGTLDLSVQEADEDIEEREELYKKNGAQPDYLSYLED